MSEKFKDVESFRTAVLSTAHMTERDNEYLSESKDLEDLYIVSYGFGWFFRNLDQENTISVLKEAGLSYPLIDLLTQLIAEGFRSVQFDADAEEYPELFPTY